MITRRAVRQRVKEWSLCLNYSLLELQLKTKTLGTFMENLSSTSFTFQIFRCSIICTSLTTWIPQIKWPSPSKQCWNEETRLGQGRVYSRGPAQTTTHCLGGGGWGTRGEIKADHINCPKSFVPHCSFLLCMRQSRENINSFVH